MSPLVIPPPAPDESAPFYHGYIARVTSDRIAEQLKGQLSELEQLFAAVTDSGALYRYAPGKWSVKEVLGHLADAERIFGYRMLRISRGDSTPLPGFDENAYVPAGRFDERRLGALVEAFRAVRQATLVLVEGTPAASWTLRGEASGNAVSARALAYIILGHVTHHLGVLRERYHLGQAPARATT
jgi:uncharacterized damage-inducible protein DinB